MPITLPNTIVCFQVLLLFVYFRCAVWHGMLVPQSGIKEQNPNHLIAREVLQESIFSFNVLLSVLCTTLLLWPHLVPSLLTVVQTPFLVVSALLSPSLLSSICSKGTFSVTTILTIHFVSVWKTTHSIKLIILTILI